MRKAVLISIKPKWCELIANGKKTVEVRKSRPKTDTPFMVYIYCTNDRSDLWILRENLRKFGGGKIADLCNAKDCGGATKANGKVIGEFVCSEIEELKRNTIFNAPALYSQSCLTRDEYFGYIGNKSAYIWYISDLKIYDRPRELSEFSPADCGKKQCFNCECFDAEKPSCTLKRPPQSWRYVEEIKESTELLKQASKSIANDVLAPATPEGDEYIEGFTLMPG